MSKQLASRLTVGREVMREQALGLRIAGLNYRDLGKALGVSHAAAHRLVREALDETRARSAEETERLRELELRRTDAVIQAHYPKRADPRSARVLLQAGERRARLLGLDAPVKLEPVAPPDERLDTSALDTHELLQLRALMLKARGTPPPATTSAADAVVDVTPEPMPKARA